MGSPEVSWNDVHRREDLSVHLKFVRDGCDGGDSVELGRKVDAAQGRDEVEIGGPGQVVLSAEICCKTSFCVIAEVWKQATISEAACADLLLITRNPQNFVHLPAMAVIVTEHPPAPSNDTKCHAASLPSRRRAATATRVLIATVAILTSALSMLTLALPSVVPDPPQPTVTATNVVADNTRPRSLDLVISHYAEDLPRLNATLSAIHASPAFARMNLTSQTSTLIYTKGPDDGVQEAIESAIPSAVVRTLPNLGREGGTYLRHIVDNYDTLADWTLFTQAEPVYFSSFLERIEKNMESRTGFLALKFFDRCGCDGCFAPSLGRAKEVWAITRGTLCPTKGFAATLNGQFLVSAKRIRENPKRVYQYLLDVITADSGHFVHELRADWLPDAGPSNPLFGHIIERSWAVIFDCADLSIEESCPWNGDGSNCQCRDE
ncbi:hypothetical protein HK101_007589 [Irineochytrium annulatum]|nr:hypothetical protein HK101_007589 [Irineochytrium annulatum]